ncbi:Tbingi protein [Trypanosoma theileri]|uniref:Tbingi protein n=1 Tax=Trypanosoma theileri TaxID=67003 RepID=A0A1X0P3I6_9TRYP|nr:Tbingi protein [Trypanosoma theileri]ORC91253.1 Tbingi protein [Trypanosoma theileri]
MSRHRCHPIRTHTSQRDECEETALHLLSCPALHPLRVQFAMVDDIPLMKLCFSKLLAQFLIAVERNYAMPQTSPPRIPTQLTYLSVRSLKSATSTNMETLIEEYAQGPCHRPIQATK